MDLDWNLDREFGLGFRIVGWNLIISNRDWDWILGFWGLRLGIGN